MTNMGGTHRDKGIQSAEDTNDMAPLPLLQKQYQDLAHKHLGELRQALFTETTGLHFHIVWTSCHPAEERAPLLTAACDICSRIADEPPPSNCCVCGQLHQDLSRRVGPQGLRFTCEFGVNNYWFSITVRGLIIGTAFVQALDKANHILRSRLRQKEVRGRTHFLSRAEFDSATRLLQFIAQSAEIAVLAELNQTDAVQVRRAMGALKKEKDSLHEHVQRLLPAENPESAQPHLAPPPMVQRMLESIHRHYTEHFTLQDCARTQGRNAAYLSDLFAHAVGVPFKTYLTELRMEKAKELLCDPDRNVNEVAQAVGYSSADRFRIVFKQYAGLAPGRWRETMRPTL